MVFTAGGRVEDGKQGHQPAIASALAGSGFWFAAVTSKELAGNAAHDGTGHHRFIFPPGTDEQAPLWRLAWGFHRAGSFRNTSASDWHRRQRLSTAAGQFRSARLSAGWLVEPARAAVHARIHR